MNIQELSEIFMTRRRRGALKKALDGGSRIISLYNLAGSSAAMLLSQTDSEGIPALVVGDSLDDAGYLYHDLSRILGEDAVLMFPSGYKRDIRYGQPDPPNQILRTEALNRWYGDRSPRFVVTYPDALAEKVAPKEVMERHTLHLKKEKKQTLRKPQNGSATTVLRSRTTCMNRGISQSEAPFSTFSATATSCRSVSTSSATKSIPYALST